MEPPLLDGYEYQHLLGSGGYSDVFLYRQLMPERPVAIKVLLSAGLGDARRRDFAAEANAMAAVSAHPFIVTIFHAAVSDSGAPYLVMEYYPRPNLGVRARSEQLSVPEVLRVGIQVASAVETAHRAGILHRDIKPANILTSEYGRPGLTDFGIAASATSGAEAAGMSVPWSPPEIVVGSGTGDHLADVYSLGATLHTLIAGRSPFELLGRPNSTLDLIERIESMEPASMGRGDVPASLERVLRQSMAKAPDARPQSAAELARQLQGIEVELKLAVTQFEVREDAPVDVRVADDDDRTHLKAPVVIRSQAPVTPLGVPPASGRVDEQTLHRSRRAGDLIAGVGAVRGEGVGTATSEPAPTVRPHGSPVAPMPTDTSGAATPVLPGPSSSPPRDPAASAIPSEGASRRNPAVMAAVAVLLVLVAMVAAKAVVGGSSTDPPRESSAAAGPQTTPPIVDSGPARPTAVTASTQGDGTILVTWQAGGDEPVDGYVVESPGGEDLGGGLLTATSATLPAGSSLCVQVSAVVDGVPSQATPSDAC
jgi:serine/threonine protein kinase